MFVLTILILIIGLFKISIDVRANISSKVYKISKYINNPIIYEESVDLFDPCIVTIEEGYLMYVSNRQKNCISCYRSTDGKKWEFVCYSLQPMDSNEQQSIVNRCDVIKINGKWIMYYTNMFYDEQGRINNNIGLAESDNGLNFVDRGIVIKPSLESEKESVMNPKVIWNENNKEFLMYYASGDAYEPNELRVAYSNDGYLWSKTENNLVLKKRDDIFSFDRNRIGACDVLKYNDKYLMLYIGYSDIHSARICYAISDDGIKWERCTDNVLVSPWMYGFDVDSCYKPTAKIDELGNICIWYNGRMDNKESIGLAVGNIDAIMERNK